MYTLLILIWLLSAVPALYLAGRAFSNRSFSKNGHPIPFLFVLGILYGVGWMIYVSMAQDLHIPQARLYDDKYLVLWGIINLGTNSIIYFLFSGARKLSNNDYPAASDSAGGFITKWTSLIGLISSVLGIVGFFWDHMSKK